MTGAPPQLSFRERQRQELRSAISLTALRLFAEQGYDAVTTEAIAAEVGISLSTFFRHVAAKEDLLTATLREGRRQIVASFAARSDDEPVVDGLAAAILQRTEQFADDGPGLELWRRAMAGAPASLRRASFVTGDDKERLVALVGQRLGVDPTVDLRPGVLVRLMLAAAEHAYELWLDRHSDVPLHALTAEVLGLARGTVQPAGTGSRGRPGRGRTAGRTD